MRAALVALALVCGCAATPRAESPVKNLSIPVRDPSQAAPSDDDTREDPPESDPSRPLGTPTIVRARLATGTELVVAPVRGAPIVEVRLVLPAAGSSADGDHTGLALVAAELALESGAGKTSAKDFAARRQALARPLAAHVSLDATVLSLAVPRETLEDALDLVSLVLRDAKLDPLALARVTRRARVDRAVRGRGDATWIAAMLAHRELHKLPASMHPYAAFDATGAEIDRVALADAKTFVKQRWVPNGASLVLVGDVDAADARALAERALAAWKGVDPPVSSFTAPVMADGLRVLVADLPGATTSELVVGALVAERTDEAWPALDVGTTAIEARLALALRDATPLAAKTYGELVEVAHGPSSWVTHAFAEAGRTGAVASVLLDELHRAVDAAPTDAELVSARRRIELEVATRFGAPRPLADALAHTAALRGMENVPDRQLARVRQVDAVAVQRATRGHLGGLLLLVVGDATRVAPLLTRLGEVTVVSPDRGFERVRTLAADAVAPVEPRAAP